MSNPQLIPLHSGASWQQQLQDAIRSRGELAAVLQLTEQELPFSEEARNQFPLLIPHAFAARMRPGDPDDPLLRQVLAAPAETTESEGYSHDPVGEVQSFRDEAGILRKYQGRALMVVTGQCAINCRYCFRRHYPYGDDARSSKERLDDLDRLLLEADLREVLLSGGDPLLLSDRQLGAIAERTAARDGVTLRIHTRLPIAIPDRVTDGLLTALSGRVVMVVHANHDAEIDDPTHDALQRLRDAGVTLLNQSVLLAGVNDDAQVLARLSDRLFSAGTLPYYLHMLDPVAGAAHFAVDDTSARRIVGRLADLRAGYLVPRLVREIPGAGSKRELAPLYQS
mgnify:CR=1 FL=1